MDLGQALDSCLVHVRKDSSGLVRSSVRRGGRSAVADDQRRWSFGDRAEPSKPVCGQGVQERERQQRGGAERGGRHGFRSGDGAGSALTTLRPLLTILRGSPGGGQCGWMAGNKTARAGSTRQCRV
jgi:hypothetical protein